DSTSWATCDSTAAVTGVVAGSSASPNIGTNEQIRIRPYRAPDSAYCTAVPWGRPSAMPTAGTRCGSTVELSIHRNGWISPTDDQSVSASRTAFIAPGGASRIVRADGADAAAGLVIGSEHPAVRHLDGSGLRRTAQVLGRGGGLLGTLQRTVHGRDQVAH